MRSAIAIFFSSLIIARSAPLPGTQALTEEGDLAAKMVQGIHRFLHRETVDVTTARAALWKPDTSSAEAWEKSMEPKRERLRRLLGMEPRDSPSLHTMPAAINANDATSAPKAIASGKLLPLQSEIQPVQWSVVRGVKGEGLMARGLVLTREDGTRTTNPPDAVIVIPDCGATPEQSFGIAPGQPPERQWARLLAGRDVLAVSLVDRRVGAAMPEGRKTKFSQREVLWRAGFELGRTLLGYEVQKVLAGVDCLTAGAPARRVLLVGSGEGGLIALLAAALDTRIGGVAVEGAAGSLDAVWQQPVDRTVFALLREFGLAEILAMISPRRLVIRDADWPLVKLTDAGGGAPGALQPPVAGEVHAELMRAISLAKVFAPDTWSAVPQLAANTPAEMLDRIDPLPETTGRQHISRASIEVTAPVPADESARQQRLFENLLADTQHLMRQAQKTRGEYWKGADFSSAEKFTESAKAYREKFWSDITGKLPPATLPPNARTRQIYETEKFIGWEVLLDVYPDVIAFGTLLLPKDIKAGEKRAVVVCQHGLEGRPSDVADPAKENPSYHRYAVRLAEKGYIIFAPQNPYIGKTEFRQICRKAWPLGLSLWSFIARQHEVILTWLKTQPNVDASRIAFYGLSYGGKSAMRLPALLPDYCLSICSADYNEWIWKNVDASAPYSYLHTMEYDMVEWNMGNTFNYAELSWLIFPRPFMVERGHDDGVSCDEWVASEFARTRRHYSKLGLGDRTEIEFFNGPHTINGQGTFRFLDKWLHDPARQ